MSYADQLRNAKNLEEQRKSTEKLKKAAEELKRQEQIPVAWEKMLDELFIALKELCLYFAKKGFPKAKVKLTDLYYVLLGKEDFTVDYSDEDDPVIEAINKTVWASKVWHSTRKTNSSWVKLLQDRYTYHTQTTPEYDDYIWYGVVAEDRDSIIEGIEKRCIKEDLTVTTQCEKRETYFFGTKRIKPSFWKSLNLPRGSQGPDEEGYYIVPCAIESDPRYDIRFTITWEP